MDQNNEPPKIVFEGEEFQRPAQSFQTPTPKMVKMVMKFSGGTVKDQRQAEWILFGFVIVAIVVSLYLFFGGGSKTKIEAPPGYKIIYPPNAPPRLEQPVQ